MCVKQQCVTCDTCEASVDVGGVAYVAGDSTTTVLTAEPAPDCCDTEGDCDDEADFDDESDDDVTVTGGSFL